MTRIYLDNAATTPVLPAIIDSMLPFFGAQFGNPSSTHAEGRASRAAIEKSRRIIAKGIGAIPAEIFFTSGGTEANNTAIKCSIRDIGIQRIISSPIEHSCVRNTVLSLRHQVEVEYVKLTKEGRADLQDLERLLAASDKSTLVSLMHANNEVGTLNNIEQISELCKKYKAYFHSDSVQTFGHIPIDVNKFTIHFLSGSAHKLHGPKGVGFLYVNKDVAINPFIDGGGQERQLRSGTENVAGIVGFAKAFELTQEGGEAVHHHIDQLRNYCATELKKAFGDKVSFNGDLDGEYLYTVLSVNFDTPIPSDMLLFRLDLQGISASGGSACNSGALKGSQVLAALEVPTNLRTVRFSFSQLNSKEEIDHLIICLKEILKQTI